ncbi:MAG TPA: UdgX family uracil-DNA binding protein [Thermoanaerobaculia bacterium]|jgi:DNA polymerase
MKVKGAEDFVPATSSLRRLAEAAQSCRGCDLYRDASRAVFGEGPRDARLVLVGEQPGDREDEAGAPFVGPAGALLDRALKESGIERGRVYVTNAVKHFKFVREGKRRIHKTPNSAEIAACRPWLSRELEVVRPKVLVCLGATASRALLGPAFRLLAMRGRFVASPLASKVLATLHPSAVLRARGDDRGRLFGLFVGDLTTAARALGV